jgi:hypothetical protein
MSTNEDIRSMAIHGMSSKRTSYENVYLHGLRVKFMRFTCRKHLTSVDYQM